MLVSLALLHASIIFLFLDESKESIHHPLPVCFHKLTLILEEMRTRSGDIEMWRVTWYNK